MTGHDAPAADGSRADLRFGKAERLRKRREFLFVQQRGQKIHLKDLLVFAQPHAGALRLGITTSAKVGGAVIRNRIRRLIREIWRHERTRLPRGYDLVLVAKRSAAQSSLESLRRQVVELVRRLRPEGAR